MKTDNRFSGTSLTAGQRPDLDQFEAAAKHNDQCRDVLVDVREHARGKVIVATIDRLIESTTLISNAIRRLRSVRQGGAQ